MNALLCLRHCLRLHRDHTRWLPPKATMATMLDTYGRDLTKVAASGDPVIGRDEEISRVVSILCRKSKNNAVLVGVAGVGKTAVAEGLAQRTARGGVPGVLAGARVVELNVAVMLAGTRYRGTFEDRMTGVIKQAEKEARMLALNLIKTPKYEEQEHTRERIGRNPNRVAFG
ncbi:hypothetical protein ACP70R_014325 [Stipagrostis hirtigluma subsp. patula]